MKLNEINSLWGINIIHLKEYSKKYRLYMSLIYLLDVIIVIGLTLMMYKLHINYNTFGFIILTLCIGVHYITWKYLSLEKWESFKFYKKYSRYTIIEKTYKVDENILYSVLYCASYKRLKQNKELKDYKEYMLNACCENVSYSKKIMKYLSKYEDNDGNLKCKIIARGKTQFFIDFVDDEKET